MTLIGIRITHYEAGSDRKGPFAKFRTVTRYSKRMPNGRTVSSVVYTTGRVRMNGKGTSPCFEHVDYGDVLDELELKRLDRFVREYVIQELSRRRPDRAE